MRYSSLFFLMKKLLMRYCLMNIQNVSRAGETYSTFVGTIKLVHFVTFAAVGIP